MWPFFELYNNSSRTTIGESVTEDLLGYFNEKSPSTQHKVQEIQQKVSLPAGISKRTMFCQKRMEINWFPLLSSIDAADCMDGTITFRTFH